MGRISGLVKSTINFLKTPKYVTEYVRTDSYPGMEKLFDGKVVLITGGSSGIGLAAAKQYLASGACVIITGRNKERLDDAARQVNSDHLKTIIWDLADFSVLYVKLKECIGMFGKIDILVNNGGVNTKRDGTFFKGWEDVTFDDWDYVMDINLKSLFFLTQAIAKLWIENEERGKHIVNVVSGSAYKPAIAPYGTSKWGVRGLTEGFGKRLSNYGIVVNGIAPGPTATAMGRVSEGTERLGNTAIPAGRSSVVEEIANTILYLSSDYCNTVIGETLRKDGGYSLTTLGEC